MRCYLTGAAVGAADPRSCHLVRVCHAVSDGMKAADASFPAAGRLKQTIIFSPSSLTLSLLFGKRLKLAVCLCEFCHKTVSIFVSITPRVAQNLNNRNKNLVMETAEVFKEVFALS